MAERRMFAKTIIDSDAFLDMPMSAQALYFHLSMRADDEGFVNSPKKIQRMIGASYDDMKLLIAKNFIIPFESGVVVIKHWRIHNYIRADRLVETKYKEERALLTVKENGSYTICDDIKEIESLDSDDKRKMAYKNSTLPYSFSYKIKRAFEGKPCPVCGKIMTSSNRNNAPSIQHNMPISKGGEHELENISIICTSCNTTIQDTETDELNNKEVVSMWDAINIADRAKIDWFWNPSILEEIDVSHLTDKCLPTGSIGKDRIGKDRLGKDIYYDSKESSYAEDTKTSKFQWLIDAWNELEVYGITPVKRITDDSKRADMIRSRLRSYSKEEVLEAIENIKSSDFLKGNGTNFKVTFDWFIRPNNFPKVLEGNYTNRTQQDKTMDILERFINGD